MMRAGKCVHHNGTINECCKAGVNYKELAGPGGAYMRRLPCVTECAGPDVKDCPERREPTAEELAASEKAVAELMERISKVRAAIVDHLGGPWKKGTAAASGSIPCPCCGGTVRFSRSGYNGHIHAACSTAGCVAWME